MNVSAEATLVLKVAYQGSGFAGFAHQDGQRTVAGELNALLSAMFKRPCEVTCAGRTDAGVHALGQMVSLPVYDEELTFTSQRILNQLRFHAPEDISIIAVYRASQGFSARFDALSRSYRYRIADAQHRPILSAPHAWWYRHALDADRMDEAARFLEGEHDFKSFCKAQSAVGKTTMREILSLKVHRIEELGESIVCIDVVGNAFLHSMVRTLTGTLVEVGCGHKEPEWVKCVLAARDRAAAGVCAPACGLTFVEVAYPEVLQPWDEHVDFTNKEYYSS